ncbi:MAG: hypothetical protein EBT63_00985 [Proteobacteria bacterium]|nr:hypothetical protein [Pseudomonadota bacterium]NCA27864.1 hypothetical protein [Pseudomonadota bacterium]
MNNQSIIKQQFNENKLSWINSLREGISVDEANNPIPWYCYQAINFLSKNLTKNDVIFEFGSGSSTIFYHTRAKKVVSIETNEIWFKIIYNYLLQTKQNPALHDNIMCFGNSEIYLMKDGLTNANYQKFAYDYSQKHQVFFDYLIIDSIKRYDCATNSIKALSINGKVILDDSERLNYKKIFDFYLKNDFEVKNFCGIAPAQLRVKNTSLITKIKNL